MIDERNMHKERQRGVFEAAQPTMLDRYNPMNTQILNRLARYGVGIALVVLGAALLIFGQPGSHGQQVRQRDQNECSPWQYRDKDGDCVDKPDVHHFHSQHHEAGSGEQCWVECLCEVGTFPASSTCAPCEFVGTVCLGH
jgi:hypothetical protein